MQKNRNLLVMAAVLVILVGISLMQKAKHEEATSGSHTQVVLAGEFSRDNLGKVILGQGDLPEAVVMSFAPDGWRLDSKFDALVSNQRLDALLRSLSNLEGEFRSDKAGVLEHYSLGEEDAVSIRFLDRQGGELGALLVGKSPERATGHFVRRPGENQVFLTQKGVLQQLGIYGPPAPPEAKHFLELQAFQADRLEVDRIVLRDGGTELDLVKEFAMNPAPDNEDETESTEPSVDRMTWEWKLAGTAGTALAKTKVDGVMGAAVSIRAQDVADPDAPAGDYGLDTPLKAATLHLQDGSTKVLEFGKERPAEGGSIPGTYFRVQGENTVWVASSYTLNNIFKTLEDLQP